MSDQQLKLALEMKNVTKIVNKVSPVKLKQNHVLLLIGLIVVVSKFVGVSTRGCDFIN